MNKTKTNLVLDSLLFVLFIIAFWLDLTGLGVHQWLGVAIGAIIAVHVLLHWKWVKNVTARFFGRTSPQARLYYVVDAALFGGLALITLTGLVISSWLDLSLNNYLAWRAVHVDVSIFTLVALVVKIGMHWQWIVKTARKYFQVQVPQPASQTALQRYRTSPVPAAAYQPVRNDTGVSRKEFLRLMGVVGVSAFVSALGVMDDETASAQTTSDLTSEILTQEAVSQEAVVVEPTATTEATATTEPTATTQIVESTATEETTIFSQPVADSATTTSQSSSSSCVVRCNRGCSYPGHCRKYTDSNGNGKCDLGECA